MFSQVFPISYYQGYQRQRMASASVVEFEGFQKGHSSLVTRRKLSCVCKLPAQIRVPYSRETEDERSVATHLTSCSVSDEETGNVWTVHVHLQSPFGFTVCLQLTSKKTMETHAFFEFRLEADDAVLSTAAGSHVFANSQLRTPFVKLPFSRRLEYARNRGARNAFRRMSVDDRYQLSFTIESEEVKETNEVTPKEHEHTTHLTKLYEGLLALQKQRIFTDVVMKVDGKEIPAHRNILASSSRYFSAMLTSNFKEGSENVVEITDFSADTIEKLIDFMYMARLPDCTTEEAYELLMASDKYELDDLKSYCADFLGKRLNVATAIESLRYADLCNADDLRKKAVRFICERIRDFEDDEDFETLLCSRPKLQYEILSLRAELKKSGKK